MSETLPPPRLEISGEQPLHTTELRDTQEFALADPAGDLPDVQLADGTPNPMDRPRKMATRVGIFDPSTQEEVGAFNLVQTPNSERGWVNDVKIDEARRGEKLAVATYVGVMAASHALGRTIESDPAGLSEDSVRVWESLTRRGVAVPLEGVVDQHGHQRYVSNRDEMKS